MNFIGTTKLNINKDLYLRLLKADDYKAIYNNYASKGNEDICKFTKWNPHENEEVTRKLVSNWVAQYSASTFRWVIATKSNNEVVGMIDVINMDLDNEEAEIGYVLASRYHNQGVMTKTVEVVCSYLFLKVKFKKLLIKFIKENEASKKVALKNGFKIIEEKELDPPFKGFNTLVTSIKLNPYNC